MHVIYTIIAYLFNTITNKQLKNCFILLFYKNIKFRYWIPISSLFKRKQDLSGLLGSIDQGIL